VDAHVHLHEGYEPARFFEHAVRNFDRAARGHGWADPTGVLLFAESAGVDWFGRLERGRARTGAWAVERTDEPTTLLVSSGAQRLVLIAGRQVVSREGLEVLLLGTRVALADRLPVRAVLSEGERAGAVRVVPWGVGKWLLGRGELLNELIDAARPDEGFFLGDSSGRPFFWGRPRHFDRAARRGLRVLPGTDPLPFPSEVTRPGSFGFHVPWAAGSPVTTAALTNALTRADVKLTPYGPLERLGPFLRHQLGMQLRKRRAAG
jgi:hypothetical protein